jgi:hypothetical protein
MNLLLFLFVIFITIYITLMFICNNQEKIVYKYIPQSPEDTLNNTQYVSDIFKTMFEEPSSWIQSIEKDKNRKNEPFNKYFIRQ